MGTILRVNLSTASISKQALSEADAKKNLGGRGLASKILYTELKRGIDPLGSENKLVYAAGPFAATGFPLNSRWLAAAKSPLTVARLGSGDKLVAALYIASVGRIRVYETCLQCRSSERHYRLEHDCR